MKLHIDSEVNPLGHRRIQLDGIDLLPVNHIIHFYYDNRDELYRTPSDSNRIFEIRFCEIMDGQEVSLDGRFFHRVSEKPQNVTEYQKRLARLIGQLYKESWDTNAFLDKMYEETQKALKCCERIK